MWAAILHWVLLTMHEALFFFQGTVAVLVPHKGSHKEYCDDLFYGANLVLSVKQWVDKLALGYILLFFRLFFSFFKNLWKKIKGPSAVLCWASRSFAMQTSRLIWLARLTFPIRLIGHDLKELNDDIIRNKSKWWMQDGERLQFAPINENGRDRPPNLE